MKKIILSQGEVAFVDDEDFERVNKFKWFIGNKGYAVRTNHIGCNQHKLCKRVSMHRFILNRNDSYKTTNQIDHADGNKLNNQKYNLRSATNSQNQMNRGKQKNNSSGFKGVSFTKRRSHLSLPWQAKIRVNKKTIYLGVFRTAKEAAVAYNLAAIKYHNEFAKLNFLEGGLLV